MTLTSIPPRSVNFRSKWSSLIMLVSQQRAILFGEITFPESWFLFYTKFCIYLHSLKIRYLFDCMLVCFATVVGAHHCHRHVHVWQVLNKSWIHPRGKLLLTTKQSLVPSRSSLHTRWKHIHVLSHAMLGVAASLHWALAMAGHQRSGPIGPSECGRDRPGFGWIAVSQKTAIHTIL